MEEVVAPCSTVVQLSGGHPQHAYILSVLAKKTFGILPDGQCVPADVSEPLVDTIQYAKDCPQRVAHDMDLFPMKRYCDFVVSGTAYAYRTGTTRIEAQVRVGSSVKTVLVMGNRRAHLALNGDIVFANPEPFERIPLSYENAYGGRDLAAEKRHGNPYEFLRPFLQYNLDVSLASPYLYPRNPVGKGFLVEKSDDGVEGLVLPNLEDPRFPLTPSRLVIGSPEHWPWAPLPQSFDWLGHGCFPRMAFLGLIPAHAKLAAPIPEEIYQYVSEGILSRTDGRASAISNADPFRFANGASLGLQLPSISPNDEITLCNLHPSIARWTIRLPSVRPRIWTDGRNGRLQPTEPVLQTIYLEPDQSRVSVIWRGSAPALRPYRPDELAVMPLKVQWPQA